MCKKTKLNNKISRYVYIILNVNILRHTKQAHFILGKNICISFYIFLLLSLLIKNVKCIIFLLEYNKCVVFKNNCKLFTSHIIDFLKIFFIYVQF